MLASRREKLQRSAVSKRVSCLSPYFCYIFVNATSSLRPGANKWIAPTFRSPPQEHAHSEAVTSLQDLLTEAERNNPQIESARQGWQAAKQVPSQVSTLPDPQFNFAASERGQPTTVRRIYEQRLCLLRSWHLTGFSLSRKAAASRGDGQARCGCDAATI